MKRLDDNPEEFAQNRSKHWTGLELDGAGVQHFPGNHHPESAQELSHDSAADLGFL